ncbi:MAG: hypothetical protein ACRDA5_09335, partial [Clostridium sp.]
MNREYENNKDVISLKSIGASKWLFNTVTNEFFSENNDYDIKNCSYNDFMKRVHYNDKAKVDEFFKGINYTSVEEEKFEDVIFKFMNPSGSLVKLLARGTNNFKENN